MFTYLLVCNFYQKRMSSSNGDDIFNWDWTPSQTKDKFISFTGSSISKLDIFNHYEGLQEEQFNQNDFNKKAQNKLRNKVNAKNSRDRKKVQFQTMSHKIRQLENQNQILKAQKHCKWCKRPFSGMLLHNQKSSCISTVPVFEYQDKPNNMTASLRQQTKQIMEFESPNFQRKKNNIGKIWIAIAVLMMVIGLRIHGMDGSKGFYGIQKVQLARGQSEKWFETFIKGKQSEEEYYDIKMQFHERKSPDKKQQYGKKTRGQFQRNIFVIQQNNRDYQYQTPEEQEFRLHKDFVYSLQAEIEDIGRYL